jgi:hypothetical protein
MEINFYARRGKIVGHIVFVPCHPPKTLTSVATELLNILCVPKDVTFVID